MGKIKASWCPLKDTKEVTKGVSHTEQFKIFLTYTSHQKSCYYKFYEEEEKTLF